MAFRLVERNEAALLHHASLVEHVDALRLADGREPVGDDDASGGEALDACHDVSLALGVEPTRGLIQKQDARFAH